MNPWTACSVGLRIVGSVTIMENQSVLRRFGHEMRTPYGQSERYAALLFYQRRTRYNSYQIYRRARERGFNSHPNVLPIIDVSETLWPVCIMSPWMQNGNIIQYTKANPSANRLTLVRTVDPEINEDDPWTTPTIACTGVPRPNVSPSVGRFTRQYRSGRQPGKCVSPHADC